MTDNIFVQEDYINRTKGHRLGDAEPYESYFTHPGEVFRYAQKEHGRCEGKVYIDGENGEALHVGWLFVKREYYTDTKESYILETWVTLHNGPAERSITYDHININEPRA